MATKKITLNELRTLVKQIIKEETMLKEDNLEVKRIARDLYTFLKKIGVDKVFLKADFKRQIGQRSGMSSGGSFDNTALIYYWDDEKTKQTLIQIILYGEISKIKSIKDKLLSTYTGLEVIDQYGDNKSINFTVREKTTTKGGLVGNTPQNKKQTSQQQPVSENLKLRNCLK